MASKKTRPTHCEVLIVVEGRGDFPIDMLRYATCVPASETDSNVIEWHAGVRRVTLRRFLKVGMDDVPVSVRERWAAFHWPVVDVQRAEA